MYLRYFAQFSSFFDYHSCSGRDCLTTDLASYGSILLRRLGGEISPLVQHA